MSSCNGRRAPPRFRSTGGLLFVAASLSLLLLLPSSSAWTFRSPLGPPGGPARPRPAVGGSAATTTAGTGTIAPALHPRRGVSPLAAGTASSPDRHRPLAEEGDWVAYLDVNYGRVYYFNHATGETAWDPPTPTFPVPRGDAGPPNGGDGDMSDGTDMTDRTNEQAARGQQQRQQQTFYEALQVPPAASRSQIKQSYLALAKLYDTRVEGGRRSREFNEIARAWMVLSDGRLRERYDRQLEQWEMERRMREKMMEEERQWAEEQQEQNMEQSMMGMENKFTKDVVYRKKMEMSDEDGTNNKFGRFRPQSDRGMGARPLEIDEEAEARGFQRAQEERLTEERGFQRAQEEQMAMAAEREALMREKRLVQEQQQARERALEEKQRIIDEREREERRRASSERDVIQDKPMQPPGVGWQQPQQMQQPKQQAQSQQPRSQQPQEPQQQEPQQERQQQSQQQSQQQPQQQPQQQQSQQQQPGQQQDMNEMMANMKQNFGAKKMDEAARVKDQLSKLQGEGGGGARDAGAASASSSGQQGQSAGTAASFGQSDRTAAPRGRNGSVLFPGKGGIVVEDSTFVAKDMLIDDYLGRKPSFISWVQPEGGTSGTEAAANFQAAMSGVRQDPSESGNGGGGGGAPTKAGAGPTGTGGVAPAAALSGERERELERLQNIKATGTGMGKRRQQQQPGGSSGNRPKTGPSPGGVGVSQASSSSLPLKTSSTAREKARLQGMKAMGMGGSGRGQAGGGNQPPFGGTMERGTLGTDKFVAPKTSATEREQRRLQGMKMGQPAVAAAATTAGGRPGANANAPSAKPPIAKNGVRELQEAHRAEMANLKSRMEDVASKTLEEEIIKIAKIHAGEITKLKTDFEASASRGAGQNAMQVEQLKTNQAAERERMREEIAREVEGEQAERIRGMRVAHEAEMERVLGESSGDGEGAAGRLRSQMDELKRSHLAELEGMAMKHGVEMGRFREQLESRSVELAEAHRSEIQKLKKDWKAASVADALKFQEVAVDKLGARQKEEIQGMAEQHELDMDRLRAELEGESSREAEARVDDATKSMAAQHRADMEKMATQHKQDTKELVLRELQKLEEGHAREMEGALADRRRLAQQAEDATRELKNPTMTKNQKIEMVLQSFEGVYDPALLEQLRTDFKAREAELDKRISDSREQISTLQHRLDSSGAAEEKLNDEIQTLTRWRESTEAELQRVKLGTAEKNKEVLSLNNSIQTMTKEIKELKSQLDRLAGERDTGKQEIWELREWKKNAEVERERLEKDLKSKDGVIAKLKYDYKERDEDVHVLVPEVARLQELTATLEELNDKRSRDYELLRQDADRLKSQYEKESRSAADMTGSLTGQLSAEQSRNAQSIAKLQDDLKTKENDMSRLQSTASERSRTITDMKGKLEEYRKESERAIEDNKKRIATMSAGFERELAQGKTAHNAELEQLKKKLQGEILRLQQDLNSRSNAITDLKTKLDASSASNKNLSGAIIGLDNQRRSTDALLKQSSHDLDATKQEVERLQKHIQVARQSGTANTAQIQALQTELTEKSAALNLLQTGANQFASEKERLLEDLNTLRQWKDSVQGSINALSNDVALNALSSEIATETQEGGTNIDSVIAKLSGIRDELNQKDAQLLHAESATDALLKGQKQQSREDKQSGDNYSMGNTIETRSPPSPTTSTVAGGAFLARKAAVPSFNVIDGGFTTRHRNVASVRTNKFSSSSPMGGAEVTGGEVPGRKTAPSPPKVSTQPAIINSPPHLTAPAKPQSRSTPMSAYDAALARAQVEKAAMVDAGKDITTTLPSTAPFAAASAKPQSSNTMSAYDAALAATQKETATPPKNQIAPTAQYAADEYRKAEKQFLMEAKNLEQVAAKSFEEAQALNGGWDKKRKDGILARANEEKARVDELFAKANEMKAKAEQSSMGP